MGGFFTSTTREQVDAGAPGRLEGLFGEEALKGVQGARSLATELTDFARRIREGPLQGVLSQVTSAIPDVLDVARGEGRDISRDIRRGFTSDFRRLVPDLLDRGSSAGAALGSATGVTGNFLAAPSRDVASSITAGLGNLLAQSPTGFDVALAANRDRASNRAANASVLGALQGLTLGASGQGLQSLGIATEGGLSGRGQDLNFRAATADRTTRSTQSPFNSLLTAGLTAGSLGKAFPGLFPGIGNFFSGGLDQLRGLFGGGGFPSNTFTGFAPGVTSLPQLPTIGPAQQTRR